MAARPYLPPIIALVATYVKGIIAPEGDPTVLIQYSIAKDWQRKINGTVRTISQNFPNATILLFMSNQQIGALADSVKIWVRKTNKLLLDVRDRSWFLERAEHDPSRERAADALAVEIADPYLRDITLAPRRPQALSSLEARAALVYLGMQWEDDTREKGLTRLCFEALVKAALRGTTPENRMTRDKVKEAVRAFMPTHDSQRLDPLTDLALQRLILLRHNDG